MKELKEAVGREVQGIACSDCNGYCDRVELTDKEKKKHHCGSCCGRTFVCKNCGTRWHGQAEAPEPSFYDED